MKDVISEEVQTLKDLIVERYGYIDSAVLRSIEQIEEWNNINNSVQDAARQCVACNEEECRE